MNRPSRSIRKLLDSVASNNEGAALDVMRAAEQLQDAIDLRIARDEIQGGAIKLA